MIKYYDNYNGFLYLVEKCVYKIIKKLLKSLF